MKNARKVLHPMSAQRRKPKAAPPPREQPDGPAVITPLHVRDRMLSTVAGAPKGYRRIDRLQWLKDHGAIGEHQLFAGRRLQRDWQIARIEAAPRMIAGGGGGSGSPGSLSDAALDAGQRIRKALAVLPPELETLTSLFLLPEDHPFSLERCAALVKEDRRAAAYGIRIALSLLARHYGYG
jgi:hypothetical protein